MPSSNVAWGIDIGAGSVKALKLERDGDNVKVADCVIIPHKKVLSSPDLDETDAYRVATGSLMGQTRDAMKNTSIVVSVPGHSAFARFAKLPPVDPKNVANLVRFEAVQQIPFPIEQVEWDYQLFASSDSPDVEVGIFAMTKDRVNERLSLWGDAGLTPDQITLGPVAAYNAMAYDLSFTPDMPGTIILDIGTVSTDLIIAEGARLWIRTFPLGGHHFTEAIATTFKLNYAKAERLKREAETSKYKKHIFQAIKPVLSDMVQDVQRSLAYYQDTHPDARISRLIGIGSTFKIVGLRKLLSQQLKMEVHRLERFKRISVDGAGAADFEASTPSLVTAYGLALQGLGLTPIRANLMPVEVIRNAMWKRKLPWFVAAAGLGIIGGGVTFLRPFLDSSKLTPIAGDPDIQRTMSTGERLKNEWQSVSQANQPKFYAANVLRLFDAKSLFDAVLTDVQTIFAAANRMTSSDSATRPSGFAFEFNTLQTDYLPPGTPLAASRGQGGPSGQRSRGGGAPDDRGWGDDDGSADTPDPAADTENNAGPFGAIRVTLTVDSQDPGRQTFFNDSVLSWLRNNAVRPEVPFTIVKVPRIEEVAVTQVRTEGGAPTLPPAAGGGMPGAPSSGHGGGMPPPGGGVFDKPSGIGGGGGGGGGGLGISGGGLGIGGGSDVPPPSPAGRPDDRSPSWQRPSGASGEVSDLDLMAPLALPPGRINPDRPLYRYTVTWYLQLKDLSAGVATTPPSPAPADGDQSARAPGVPGGPSDINDG